MCPHSINGPFSWVSLSNPPSPILWMDPSKNSFFFNPHLSLLQIIFSLIIFSRFPPPSRWEPVSLRMRFPPHAIPYNLIYSPSPSSSDLLQASWASVFSIVHFEPLEMSPWFLEKVFPFSLHKIQETTFDLSFPPFFLTPSHMLSRIIPVIFLFSLPFSFDCISCIVFPFFSLFPWPLRTTMFLHPILAERALFLWCSLSFEL